MISWIVLFLAVVVVGKSVQMVWVEMGQTERFRLKSCMRFLSRSTS